MSALRLLNTVGLLAVVLIAPPLHAAPVVDPQAKDILSAAVKKYASLTTYRHTEKTTVTRSQGGRERKESLSRTFVFNKPNKYRLQQPGRTIASDGALFRTYYPSLGQYTHTPAPPHGVTRPLRQALMERHLDLILTALLANDPLGQFLPRFKEIKYLGRVERSGKALHKLRLLATRDDTTMLIGADDGLVVELDVSPTRSASATWHLLVQYRDIAVNESPTPGDFKVVLRRDARKVDRISFTRKDDYPHVNQLLPKTKLARLDDGRNKVRPAELLGEVNFVTFWASWCMPCRIELPELQKLYDTYRRQGFKVIAVNTDKKEDYSRMKRFVRQAGLTFPLLLDPKGKLAGAVDVEVLPTLLIVDKSGRILEAHTGLNPRPQFEFRQIIEQALADKKKSATGP